MTVPADFDWRAPDYTPILRERGRRLEWLAKCSKDELDGVMGHYATRPADWISDWGWTFDPRAADVGRPTTMPFLLFDKQREAVDWIVARWRGREDGLVEKSRDMGVTWLCVGIAAWIWTFHAGTVVGFGSRKEDLVDRIGDPDAIFWRLRFYISSLPPRMRPKGYDEAKHAPFLRIINPANGAVIRGEAGDNIGRGGRASLYIKDEAQPLSAKILTPFGWATMGDMAVGSEVIGPDGKPRTVTHINEAGLHPVYRVRFSDGTSTECSPNHLWSVEVVYGTRKMALLTTKDIAATFAYDSPGGQRHYRYRVGTTAPVEFEEAQPLPLDPYLLGVLIGDGCLRGSTPVLTSADADLVSEVSELVPDGVSVVGDGRLSFRLVNSVGWPRGRYGPRNDIASRLRAIGAHGCLAHEKSIPRLYLLASPSSRLALLQGLMDTDGSASGGVASFHTSSPRLAADVRFLVESLGGTATRNVKPDKRGHRDMHVLHICLAMPLFRLRRKLDSLKPRKHPPGRTILGVEFVRMDMVRCITVDAPDGLYLTDHCIVTHNSAHYERPDAIDASLSQTTNCQIDVSTPNGEGNPFWRKRMGGRIKVLTFDWRDDPRKDQAWYDKQVATRDPVTVAQEIDRDYSASVSNSFIPGALVTKAMSLGPADVQATGPLRVGLDVARFGDDKCVLTFRRGRVVVRQVEWGKTDLMSTAGRAKQEIMTFIRSRGAPLEQIAVDSTGIGAGVADALRGWPETGQYVVDVDSAAGMGDGEHYNLRAFMWQQMRQWLEGVCSLPNDQNLRADLTGLRYSYRGGLLLLESKEDAKKRGVRSPDRADSLALTFAKPGPAKKPDRKIPAGAIVSYPVDEFVGA